MNRDKKIEKYEAEFDEDVYILIQASDGTTCGIVRHIRKIHKDVYYRADGSVRAHWYYMYDRFDNQLLTFTDEFYQKPRPITKYKNMSDEYVTPINEKKKKIQYRKKK